ncbi:hypothetical protein F0L74_17400 [Chitinophaga agrisoli]|uniref:DUF4397 domain-containing protein n=1 Tax=Chitinophaga agrisoli TaxID=2607653 RepID=A0A5B2VS39_9BACT|nr:hypothetical protein [Chitinophaga agrisoli]KAA2241654.1 hypothetical protein F0L74_17400 [Chitinophaga agrisoli]
MRGKILLFVAAIVISSFLILTSCKKGEPIEETNFINISISKLFRDSPSMDIYVNGTLNSTLPGGEQSLKVLLPQNSSNVEISFKKHDDSAELIDTVLASLKGGIGLTYLYNESLGFNQFIGSEFRQPSSDSMAVQFLNNFNYGSGKINVFIYKSVDGYSYSDDSKVDSLMDINANKVSDVKVLPYLDETGQRILYAVVVVDAVTGYNGVAEYYIDLGYDPYSGGWPISAPPTDLAAGKLSIVKVENFPYDENGKHYEQINMGTIFEY